MGFIGGPARYGLLVAVCLLIMAAGLVLMVGPGR